MKPKLLKRHKDLMNLCFGKNTWEINIKSSSHFGWKIGWNVKRGSSNAHDNFTISEQEISSEMMDSILEVIVGQVCSKFELDKYILIKAGTNLKTNK